MSKQEYDTNLRFGQGILIEGFKTDGKDQGFLTAQGFADIKVKYETCDDILYFKNYRNAIFQILPAGNFQLNDELQKALIQNEGHEDTSNILILRARAESEKYQFQLNIENNMKKKICFGQSVIFKHIDSQSYVSGTIRPSTGSNGAFTVQVSEKLSDSLVFKLQPYRSFEFTDMPIPFDSPIIIKNEFNNGFLTFQKIGMAEEGSARGTYINKKPIESNDTYSIPVKTPTITSDNYEVVTHFVDLSCQREVPMPWRFKLHVNDVINDTLIQHDVVYLQHTENAGILSSSGKNIILKELKERENEDLAFYDCLWEIEKHDASDDAYILRHLMSGMILGQEEGEDLKRRAVLVDISEGKPQEGEISYVEVRLAKKEGGDINSESFVSIAWGEELLETDDAEGALQASATKERDPTLKVDLVKMKDIYKKNIQYNIRPLSFKKSVAQEHCFVIMEIEDELKQDLLFALSFHSVIIRLREDLKYGAIEAAKKISYLRMMQVTSKIKEIKKFVKGCSEEEAELEHIFPLTKRQMICKDLGISELLFELLYFMKMNLREDIFSDQHNQREKFMELYNTLYEVNRELIRKNYLFKMHVSKWFQFILDDVVSGNQACQLLLLKELLEENDFFTSNFVTQEIVEYLTSCFNNKSESEEFYERKYLQLFRLFSISGTKVNTNNQKLILDFFLKQLQEARSIFEIRLEKEEAGIIVAASLDKAKQQKLLFNDFYSKCTEKYSSAWLYFVQYLNLMADLAQGRNKITEQELCKIFPLNLLGDLFENYELYEAEVPVIRLLHYLYTETEKYYPIERRRRLFNINSLEGTDSVAMNCTSSIQKPWEPPLDRILVRLLNRLKAFGPIETTGENGTEDESGVLFKQNCILLTLLKFLWETINLGFWSNKESIKEILRQVLVIVEKGKFINYANALIESKENKVMIDCKIQCLNIIELVADLDNDIMIQSIASMFKKLEFRPKTFNLKGMLNSSTMMEIKCDHELVNNFLPTLPSEEEVQPIIQTSICDQMIELTNYRNAQLTSGAISIIDRVLQTRKKAFEHFSELIIISEEERLKLVDFMEFHRSKFFILDDPNTASVTEDNQVCNYFMVSDPENLGLLEVLYLLTELMKNENSILEIERIKSVHESGVYEALGCQRLINFTGERSSTNRMKQQIVYSSNLHIKVLNFIFSCTEIPETELGLKLLHMSYYYIVALIENFNQIKGWMMWHIPKMIHHIQKNVGCIDFLKEMYDNNKTMLYQELAVFDLIKMICENIEGEPEDSYYKSKLMDFFRYLIYCNGRCLRTHQIQILKIMQDDSYHSIMIPTNYDLPALIEQYEADNADSKEVIMSPQLTYFCSFFQIMSALIDNNNAVNIGKLVKRYPFDLLVTYIEQAKSCWTLKRNLRALINRLYYFQKGLDVYLKPILIRELPNLCQDLHMYILAKHQGDVVESESKKFRNPVRFSYLQSFRYLLIEQSFFTLISMSSKEVTDEVVKYLNKNASSDIQTAYNVFKIIERLAWIQQFFTKNGNVYSNSMIKFLLSKMKPLLQSLEEPALFHAAGMDAASFVNAKKSFIEKLLSGRIGIFYEEHSPAVEGNEPLSYSLDTLALVEKGPQKKRDQGLLRDVLRQIFKREKKDFANEDEHINYNLQQLISSLKLSAEIQNYTNKEYLEKVDTYYKRKNSYKFIKRIISLNSRNPTALTSQQKIFFLQYIIGFIESANAQPKSPEEAEPKGPEEEGEPKANEEAGEPQFKKEIDEWEADDWKDSKDAINATQINLKKRDLGKFIVDLLKEDITNNIELANSILLCAIAYLLGGNSVTQKNVLEELDKDEESKVFANIEALIFKLGKLIRKSIDEANTQKDEDNNEPSQFSLDKIDNYDFFDARMKYTMRKNVSEPNSTDEFLYGKLCITTYRRAFKFLQIMCENNNKESKNFIRVQPGKSRQFNFIDITTKQLRNLFQIYCYDIRIVPLFLLDFILEVTQVPIYENQTALMNSTFFEDLCQLKNAFTFPDDEAGAELLNKKLAECNFKDLEDVNQIFFKSFKIIQSNFEGNDDKTFSTLDTKLQAKFLTSILKEKLKSMEIDSCDKLVERINNHSNTDDEEGNKRTDFDEDILILLDIITIYKQMKGAAVLQNNSRVYKAYQKFKKEEMEAHRLIVRKGMEDQGHEELKDLGEEEKEAKLQQLTDQRMKDYKCTYSHLETLLLSIEVTDEKGKDQTLYFPNYPVFSSLTGNLRDYVMVSVTRDSHRDKIVSLLSYTEGVKDKIEYSYNLKKKKNINESNMDDSFSVASKLSVFICLYITLFYQVSVEYQQAEYYSSFAKASGLFVLSFIQLVFTILYVFYWFQLRLWYNPDTINREGNKEEEGGGEEAEAEAEAPKEGEENEEDEEGEGAPVRFQIAEEKGEEGEGHPDAPPEPENLPFWQAKINQAKGYSEKALTFYEFLIEQLTTEEQRIYKNAQLWRNGLFLMASIIGTFYFPPMFFLHLIIIFARNDKLGTILVSAVYNMKSLIFISGLGVVFTVVFCIVTFSNYMKNVYSPGDDPADMCDGVMNCFSQLYVSGAIGETMEEFEIVRFMYDIIYLTFFDMLFSNIVSGLMLDAFSSLREEADNRDSDKENFCYICNISRESLQKQGEDFAVHTREKHFLWNYIFYIYVLERKDETDYTGLEYQIRKQYYKSDEEMEVNWIPNKGDSEFDVQTEATMITDDVKAKLEESNNKLATLDDTVNEFKKIAREYLE